MSELFAALNEPLSVESVRERRDETLATAFEQDATTLVEALPAMGKSYGVVKWAETTGEQLSIFTSRGELYGQYQDWCEERNLSHIALPAFHSDCESINDGKPLVDGLLARYEAGISGAELHRDAERYFGEPLPCQEDGPCPYMEKREFNPEDYDVLIGHYLQAHNQDYIEGRYVAFDEFPGDAFFFEPTHNDATRAITNYLEIEDELPFDNWKELTRERYKPEYSDAINEWKQGLGYYSHRDTRRKLQQSPDFHAHAPLLTHAGLEFELLDNEWEYAELGMGRVAVKSPEDEWTVLIPPSLYPAESVVALDGTPTVSKWRIVLGGNWIEHEEVLNSNGEKREYLREVLGLNIIQTKAGAKPYQSGVHVNLQSDGALLEGIKQREGRCPAVISSKKALEQYDSEGLDHLIEGAEHFGNLKGSNEFETTRVGAVIGSPHPPEDEGVERWAALDGEAASRKEPEDGETGRGTNLDFGRVGNALFRDVVHKEVLQAIMRFGRTPDEDGQGATVYVHTSRLPQWIDPIKRIEVRTWSEGMKDVVEAIRDSEKWADGEWTNSDIAEDTSIRVRQVRRLTEELSKEGYLSVRKPGRAYRYSNECLEEFNPYGTIADSNH